MKTLALLLLALLSVKGYGQTTSIPEFKICAPARADCWPKDKVRVQHKTVEPMDVPVVRETFYCFGFTGEDCDETRPLKPFYELEYFPGSGHVIFGRPAVMPQRLFWCADKSRILLTDESGGKHCIKFPSN